MQGDIPSAERQAWLLEQLAHLISVAGEQHFLHAPILEPTPRYFPEGWSPDLEGAKTITRRLLDHAQLHTLDLELVEFANVLDDPETDSRHALGYFKGISDGVCLFGVNVPLLVDPEYVAGVMAHEVSHAFRHHHRLRIDDRAVEEELTDLTTVFLGGAIVTGNLSERVVVERTPRDVQLRRSAAGYLSVEDFAFLLAVQLHARGRDEPTIARLTRFLGSSQRYCLNHCLAALDMTSEALRRKLGATAAAQHALAAIVEARAPAPLAKHRARLWGHTTYIFRDSHATKGLLVGVALGFVLMVGAHDDRAVAGWAALSLLGALLGLLIARPRCSACRSRIPGDARECPGCAAFVLGSLRHPPTAFNVGENRRSRVTRVRVRRTAQSAGWGAILGSGLGMMLFGFGLSLGIATLVALAGAVAGGVIGRRVQREMCGGKDCRTFLEPFVSVCPRCLGELGAARELLP